MKKNIFNKKWLVAGVFACAMAGFTSCEDFLTVLPTDQITEEDFWKTKNDLNNARAGAYLHMTKTGALERAIGTGEWKLLDMGVGRFRKKDKILLKLY